MTIAESCDPGANSDQGDYSGGGGRSRSIRRGREGWKGSLINVRRGFDLVEFCSHALNGSDTAGSP